MKLPLFTLAPLVAVNPVIPIRDSSPTVVFHPKTPTGETITVDGSSCPGELCESYLGMPFAE